MRLEQFQVGWIDVRGRTSEEERVAAAVSTFF